MATKLQHRNLNNRYTQLLTWANKTKPNETKAWSSLVQSGHETNGVYSTL